MNNLCTRIEKLRMLSSGKQGHYLDLIHFYFCACVVVSLPSILPVASCSRKATSQESNQPFPHQLS